MPYASAQGNNALLGCSMSSYQDIRHGRPMYSHEDELISCLQSLPVGPRGRQTWYYPDFTLGERIIVKAVACPNAQTGSQQNQD